MYINLSNIKIYSYDVISDNWSPLPDSMHLNSSITIINGQLTTVGGGAYPIYSNELFSLTGEGSDRRWTKKFPPMPTKRSYCTTTVCTGATVALIVAGGVGEGGKVLSTVEVMDTETHQWSTAAADLPGSEPVCCASATVCGDQFYMLGGFTDKPYHGAHTRSVYTCSVSTLLQSCVRRSQQKRSALPHKARVWRRVADLPVKQSTCESFHGQLLAIGGKKDSQEPSTAVYMYNSTTNSWEIISHMTTGRYHCFTAVLPNNQLMALGGKIARDESDLTDSVEIAHVYY